MRLLLLGPPGAGKGTQAERLARTLGIVHLSSGDILRAERKNETELGRRAQDYMDRGELVPDDLILDMMMTHIGRSEADGGFLLDGFPRTVVQARCLDERLTAEARPIDKAVEMRVSDEDVMHRLTGRWSCPNDGRVYHESFSRPTREGRCDDCGEPLVRRKDDEPQVVRRRLATYHAETEPLVTYYRERGILETVDGSVDANDVTARIAEVCGAP